MILDLCKGVHRVDLGESFQLHIFLQKLVSMQPRTSPLKFAEGGSVCALGVNLTQLTSTTRWSGASPGGGRAPISERKNKAWHPVMMALSERFTFPFSDRYNIQLSERCQFPLSERYRIPLSEKESIPFSERSSTRTSDYALKRNIPWMFVNFKSEKQSEKKAPKYTAWLK